MEHKKYSQCIGSIICAPLTFYSSSFALFYLSISLLPCFISHYLIIFDMHFIINLFLTILIHFSDSFKLYKKNCYVFQVLTFFAAQVATHHNYLTQAIDAFLQTVEHNQPPKVFLAHGKFVVLSAHKLVHIGDTVHRNVTQTDIRARALNCANALSEALAASVTKTKQAALQFPSVNAVQEMVDSVVDISHLARDLKLCLVQASLPI